MLGGTVDLVRIPFPPPAPCPATGLHHGRWLLIVQGPLTALLLHNLFKSSLLPLVIARCRSSVSSGASSGQKSASNCLAYLLACFAIMPLSTVLSFSQLSLPNRAQSNCLFASGSICLQPIFATAMVASLILYFAACNKACHFSMPTS